MDEDLAVKGEYIKCKYIIMLAFGKAWCVVYHPQLMRGCSLKLLIFYKSSSFSNMLMPVKWIKCFNSAATVL